MREKLNENQNLQIALVAVLVVVVGYFMYSNFAGGSSSASEVSEPAESTPTAATVASGTPPPVHPLPKRVDDAYKNGSTVVLLIHRDGGIDDRKVREAANVLSGMSDVAYFPVSVDKIATYAAITGPLGVSSAPALVVVRPRRLNDGGAAQATVTYGFQTAADIRQAVRDANYQGPTLTYAPQ
ncbi:MAG: hypothetical protein JST53_03915 [Actinobacteria bacterium]|nr:hypothetical protein [Actinomycetota bacterium]